MQYLKKIDILFFSYLVITTILLVFSWETIENPLVLLAIRFLVLSVSIGVIYLNIKVKNQFVLLIRKAYPILFSMLFYTETVHYNKLFFTNLDDILLQADAFIFGFQPSIAFSDYFSHPIFSELMYIGYFSLYIIIIAFIYISFFKQKQHTDELFFKLATTMLLFYLFFGFFPAAGPQFYFSSPEKDLPTAFIFDKIMHFIQQAEQPTGAFPSSHVGISIIILLLMRKRVPLFFKIAVPFVILLILSTVYIKAHYAVDAIAGIMFAPIILYLGNILYKKIPTFKI